jgi:endonuclease YncB( thermonuclease family)
MRRILGSILGAVLAVLATASTGHAQTAGGLQGMPSVIDGDTIWLDGRTLRLHGIDAPELGQTCDIKGRTYDCGVIARSALMDLTAGTQIACEFLDQAKVSDAEPPGDVVRCTARGYDLSEGMAYTGWALADRKATDRYVGLEKDARAKKRGMWKGTFVTPWDWRGGKRLAKPASE